VSALPERVRVMEVGPRDGLQNEAAPVSTADKIRFVDALTRAGLLDIEVSSFVRPDRVPQLADARDVFAGIERREGVRYWALIPNRHGLDAALEAGVTHVAVFTAASDGFNRANVNASVEESLARLRPVIVSARDAGATVRGYVSTAFGCPYDGKVDPARAAAVSRALFDAGCTEISVGDTIGVAVPTAIHRVLDAHEAIGVPRDVLALHLHDTRGAALANVLAGMLDGVTVFDSTAGGLGGCPFAPGATGNLATEDLLHLLHGMGIETGVSLDGVARASGEIGNALGRPLPSRARAAWAVSAGR
jgi:hydroxymethylglutaryl-CoA lyase